MTTLKGVNKTVLELSNPDSDYFERIVFYVKPNLKTSAKNTLRSEAEHILAQLSPSRPSQIGKQFLLRLLAFSLSAAGGAAITAFWLK